MNIRQELARCRGTGFGDIDAFDDDVYDFSFRVPNDIEEKTYSLSNDYHSLRHHSLKLTEYQPGHGYQSDLLLQQLWV